MTQRQGLSPAQGRSPRTGGAVFAPNLPDYVTADGKMLTTIQLAIDRAIGTARAKSWSGKRARSSNGIPVVTRPAVGYRKRADKRLEPDPRIAPIVREVFERRRCGERPTALARVPRRARREDIAGVPGLVEARDRRPLQEPSSPGRPRLRARPPLRQPERGENPSSTPRLGRPPSTPATAARPAQFCRVRVLVDGDPRCSASSTPPGRKSGAGSGSTGDTVHRRRLSRARPGRR